MFLFRLLPQRKGAFPGLIPFPRQPPRGPAHRTLGGHSRLHPSRSRARLLLAHFIGPAPPIPARPASQASCRRDAGITGTPGWGSGCRPAASQSLSESSLSPALRGAFPTKAGRCRGTGSRGSAPGTSLIPHPPRSRRVAGPGPTAAPHSTGWRSCCAALVGKGGPLRRLPRGQDSPSLGGRGIFSNLRSPIPVLQSAGEQS